MRTTLTLDDDLVAALKREAGRTGKAFKDVVNDVVRAGLEAGLKEPAPRRYRLTPVRLGHVTPGINLDKALQLADELEDHETAHELERRR